MATKEQIEKQSYMRVMKAFRVSNKDTFSLNEDIDLFCNILRISESKQTLEMKNVITCCLPEIPFFDILKSMLNPSIFDLVQQKLKVLQFEANDPIALNKDPRKQLHYFMLSGSISISSKSKEALPIFNEVPSDFEELVPDFDPELLRKFEESRKSKKYLRLTTFNIESNLESNSRPVSIENIEKNGIVSSENDKKNSDFGNMGQVSGNMGQVLGTMDQGNESELNRSQTSVSPRSMELNGKSSFWRSATLIDRIRQNIVFGKKVRQQQVEIKKNQCFQDSDFENIFEEIQIKATSHTKLVVLNSSNFKKITKLNTRKDMQKKIDFLLSLPMFEGSSKASVAKLFPFFKEKEFNASHSIMTPGQRIRHVYFIYEGGVEVIRDCGVSRNLYLKLMQSGDTKFDDSEESTREKPQNAEGTIMDAVVPLERLYEKPNNFLYDREASHLVHLVVPMMRLGKGEMIGEEVRSVLDILTKPWTPNNRKRITEPTKQEGFHPVQLFHYKTYLGSTVFKISVKKLTKILIEKSLTEKFRKVCDDAATRKEKRFQEEVLNFCKSNFGTKSNLALKLIHNSSAFRVPGVDDPGNAMFLQRKKFISGYKHEPRFVSPRKMASENFPAHFERSMQEENTVKEQLLPKIEYTKEKDDNFNIMDVLVPPVERKRIVYNRSTSLDQKRHKRLQTEPHPTPKIAEGEEDQSESSSNYGLSVCPVDYYRKHSKQKETSSLNKSIKEEMKSLVMDLYEKSVLLERLGLHRVGASMRREGHATKISRITEASLAFVRSYIRNNDTVMKTISSKKYGAHRNELRSFLQKNEIGTNGFFQSKDERLPESFLTAPPELNKSIQRIQRPPSPFRLSQANEERYYSPETIKNTKEGGFKGASNLLNTGNLTPLKAQRPVRGTPRSVLSPTSRPPTEQDLSYLTIDLKRKPTQEEFGKKEKSKRRKSKPRPNE